VRIGLRQPAELPTRKLLPELSDPPSNFLELHDTLGDSSVGAVEQLGEVFLDRLVRPAEVDAGQLLDLPQNEPEAAQADYHLSASERPVVEQLAVSVVVACGVPHDRLGQRLPAQPRPPIVGE
jgi:hypothetical protein